MKKKRERESYVGCLGVSCHLPWPAGVLLVCIGGVSCVGIVEFGKAPVVGQKMI